MGNLAKREKTMLMVLGFVIVAYLYYNFLLNPYLKKMETSRENIKKYTAEVTRIRNAKAEIENKKKELEGLKVQLTDALKVLPESERQPELMLTIKQLGDASLVAVGNNGYGTPADFALPGAEPKTPAATEQNKNAEQNKDTAQNNQAGQAPAQPAQPVQKKLYMVPVTMAAEGIYPDIMNFVNALETNKRFAQIRTIGMSPAQDTGKLTANLVVEFYYSENVTGEEPSYDFNTGTYGKTDLFK